MSFESLNRCKGISPVVILLVLLIVIFVSPGIPSEAEAQRTPTTPASPRYKPCSGLDCECLPQQDLGVYPYCPGYENYVCGWDWNSLTGEYNPRYCLQVPQPTTTTTTITITIATTTQAAPTPTAPWIIDTQADSVIIIPCNDPDCQCVPFSIAGLFPPCSGYEDNSICGYDIYPGGNSPRYCRDTSQYQLLNFNISYQDFFIIPTEPADWDLQPCRSDCECLSYSIANLYPSCSGQEDCSSLDDCICGYDAIDMDDDGEYDLNMPKYCRNTDLFPILNFQILNLPPEPTEPAPWELTPCRSDCECLHFSIANLYPPCSGHEDNGICGYDSYDMNDDGEDDYMTGRYCRNTDLFPILNFQILNLPPEPNEPADWDLQPCRSDCECLPYSIANLYPSCSGQEDCSSLDDCICGYDAIDMDDDGEYDFNMPKYCRNYSINITFDPNFVFFDPNFVLLEPNLGNIYVGTTEAIRTTTPASGMLIAFLCGLFAVSLLLRRIK